MRKNSILIIAFCGLIILGVMSGPAWAQLPWFDDFNDGNADGWTVVSGEWSVVNGEYAQSNYWSNGGYTPYGLDMMSIVNTVPFSDYTVQARVRFETPTEEGCAGPCWTRGWSGLVFRYQDTSNYYTILLWTDYTSTSLEFWTYVNGWWTLVATQQVDVDPLGGNTITAQIQGETFHFYLNNQYVFSGADSTLASGDAGFYTEQVRARFDDWRMMAESPVSALQQLIDLVVDLNLQAGISNSLDTKLEAAVRALDDVNQNNDVAAINALEAFIGAVEAQRNVHLSDAEADSLILVAQQIIQILVGG